MCFLWTAPECTTCIHKFVLLQGRVETMRTPGERLQAISEQNGRLLSITLDSSGNETVSTSLVGSRNNTG